MGENPQEQWIPIPNLDAYAVSNFGRVMRAKRGNRTRIGYIAKPYITRHGYFRVCLTIDNHSKKHFVHRLVMLAFVGECPDGMEVNHKDGNKLNNHLDNLEYVTRADNQKHSYKIGLTPRMYGEKARNWKMTDAQIDEIRRLYAEGMLQREIAVLFKLSQQGVSNIVNFKRRKTPVTIR